MKQRRRTTVPAEWARAFPKLSMARLLELAKQAKALRIPKHDIERLKEIACSIFPSCR